MSQEPGKGKKERGERERERESEGDIIKLIASRVIFSATFDLKDHCQKIVFFFIPLNLFFTSPPEILFLCQPFQYHLSWTPAKFFTLTVSLSLSLSPSLLSLAFIFPIAILFFIHFCLLRFFSFFTHFTFCLSSSASLFKFFSPLSLAVLLFF